MLLSRRVIAQAVNLRNATGVLRNLRKKPASVVSPLRLAAACRCMCSDRNDSGKKDEKNENSEVENETEIQSESTAANDVVSSYLQDKFVLFKDRDSEVILDIHEEFQKTQGGILYYPEKPQSNLEIQRAEHSVERGKTGVYDIEDLVTVLEAENARNVCVIQMPPEMLYADYLVIASGRSARHHEAMMEFIRKLYKIKMHKTDSIPNVQGQNCKKWIALDMGNIVLHLILAAERDKFDIESLWAVGEKYDDNCIKPQDEEASTLQEHLKFLESLQLGNQEMDVQP